MTWPANYHTILYDEYPDVFQLWAEAVEADDASLFLYEEGKVEESNAMCKLHEEKWAEYLLASKLIFEGWKDEEE